MARLSGKNLHVTFNSVVLTADFRSGEESRSAELIDASAGDDAHMTYLVDKTDGTFTVEFIDDTAHAAFDACAPGTEASLVWGPDGNTTGLDRYTVNAIVANRTRTNPYRDVQVVTVEFQFSGAVTQDAYS